MMSFDGGFEFLGGLVGLALLRSGKQSIHGDLGLLGQVQRLVKRIGWFSGNDVVRGKHDGCGALTLGIVGAGNVGSKVAEVGKRLGMKVLLNDLPAVPLYYANAYGVASTGVSGFEMNWQNLPVYENMTKSGK